ncbi:MAG TPA: isoprenylcysteine carboxylmethyltransferase family protein [Terriglobales bacterium]|nr:isoprenylcysteine carboxylmethyltransferase family protein [Terriglobales bacterium]
MAEWSRIARRIRVPLGFAFAAFYLWIARPTWTSLAIGALVTAPGILLRALASGHVKKNEELTTSGPYAYTRNPLYLGSLIMAVGFAIAARSIWVLIVMFGMFAAIYLPVIRAEEKFLRSTFSNFDDYAQNVPRLLPRPSPYRDGGGVFSRPLYWQHREYNAILGTAAVLAALMAKLLWASR